MNNKYFITDFPNNEYWKILHFISKNNVLFKFQVPFEKNKKYNGLANSLIEFFNNLSQERLEKLVHGFEKEYSNFFEIALYYNRQSKILMWNSSEKYFDLNLDLEIKEEETLNTNFSLAEFEDLIKIQKKNLKQSLKNFLKNFDIGIKIDKCEVNDKQIAFFINENVISIQIKEFLFSIYKLIYHEEDIYKYLDRNLIFFELLKHITSEIKKDINSKKHQDFMKSVNHVLFYQKNKDYLK